MKKIISLLSLCFIFVSCGGNATEQKDVVAQEPEKILTCDENIEASQARLLEVNKNPTVTISFLGKVESGTKCFLKMQIMQTVGERKNIIFSLFNTKAEKNYGNYTSFEDMETAVTELTQ